MSRTQVKPTPVAAKSAQRQELWKQFDAHSDDQESEDSDVEIQVDGEFEKDETEEELERLVFGDSTAFREGLKDFTLDEEEADNRDARLEGLDNADLFFTDRGAGDVSATVEDAESEDETILSRQPPAWEDSDDERMMVSLANVPRLRKLRRTEAEDVVNGKEYSKRLRKQFQLLHPVPEWAQNALQKPAKKKRRLSGDSGASDDEDEDAMDLDSATPSVAPIAELLQNAELLVRESGPGAGKKRKLRPETIDIQRQKDIPGVQPSSITSLSFHPKLPLLLSSGPSATLYLHHLAPSPPAPEPNPLLTSLHIRGFQLSNTAFHPTDSSVFLSAPKRYFHVWNLDSGQVEKISQIYGQRHEQGNIERFKLSPDGQYMAIVGTYRKSAGIINILNASTMQWISQARIESRNGLAEFAWWRDSKGMTIAGKNGEVTEWEVRSQSVVARWQDEGAVGTTTIALGGQHDLASSPIGTDRWIAIGSSSGIVNIYDRRAWLNSPKSKSAALDVPANPKPTRMLDHLTTPISNLTFSHDGQVMAMSSQWKKDALRLVHLPSCTVYRNWPTDTTPLGRITSVAFAKGDIVEGGKGDEVHSVLAVASQQGKIRVWEIR